MGNVLNSLEIVEHPRNYFRRNKNHSLFFDIIAQDRERHIILNTAHNIIEIKYFTGKKNKFLGKAAPVEDITNDWFGVSFEILDALFNKYKEDKSIAVKLITFCMRSKSRAYWYIIKDTKLAQELMAAMLGGE